MIPEIIGLENKNLNLPDSYLEIVEKTLPYYEKRSKKFNVPFEKYRNALIHLVINCGVMKGGIKRNVVPDYAEAEFDFRLPPCINVTKVKEMINEIITLSKIDGVEIVYLSETDSSYQHPDCDIFRAAKKAIFLSGEEKEPLALVKTSFTDARYTRKAGIPTIIIGHDGSGGHVANEYSEIDEVLFTTRVYLNTIFEYFNMHL